MDAHDHDVKGQCTCFERSGVKCRRRRPRLPGLCAAALSATLSPALRAATHTHQCIDYNGTVSKGSLCTEQSK